VFLYSNSPFCIIIQVTDFSYLDLADNDNDGSLDLSSPRKRDVRGSQCVLERQGRVGGSSERVPPQLNNVPLTCWNNRAIRRRHVTSTPHLLRLMPIWGHSMLRALVLATHILFDTIRCRTMWRTLHFSGAGSPPHSPSSFTGVESPPPPTSSFWLPFASFHPPHPGLTPLWRRTTFKCRCEHLVLLAPPLLHLPLLFSALSASFRQCLSSNLTPWLWNPPHLVHSRLQALVLAAPISFDTVRCRTLRFAGAGSPPHLPSVFSPLRYILLTPPLFDAILVSNGGFFCWC
jgi:hypothetical protein